METPSLEEIEKDTGFLGLNSQDQDRIRLGFLRTYVLPDSGFRNLSPQDKATIATRVMVSAPPEGFLSSLIQQQTEAIRALPGAIPEILAQPAQPAQPPPVRVPSLAARWGHPPSISQPTAEDLIAKPTEEQSWADIRKGAVASVMGAATGQPVTPPLPAPRLAAGPAFPSVAPPEIPKLLVPPGPLPQKEQPETEAILRRAGSAIVPRRTLFQSIAESKPLTAITTGQAEGPEGQLARIFDSSGVVAGTVEELRKELGENPTTLDNVLRMGSSLFTPASIATLALFAVRLPVQAVQAGLARVFGEKIATQAVARATAGSVRAGTSLAGYNLVQNALGQTSRAIETGQPASIRELAGAGAHGAALGAALGPTAIIPNRMLAKAAEAGVFATVPSALERRLPTFEDVIEAGLFVGAMGLAHALPERAARAIAKPATERTEADRTAIRQIPPEQQVEILDNFIRRFQEPPAAPETKTTPEPPRAPTIAPEPPAAPAIAVQPGEATVAPVAPRGQFVSNQAFDLLTSSPGYLTPEWAGGNARWTISSKGFWETVDASPGEKLLLEEADALQKVGANLQASHRVRRAREMAFERLTGRKITFDEQVEGKLTEKGYSEATPSAPAVTPPRPTPVTEVPRTPEQWVEFIKFGAKELKSSEGDTGRYFETGQGVTVGVIETSAPNFRGRQPEFAQQLTDKQNELAKLGVTVPRSVVFDVRENLKGSKGYPDGRVPFTVSETLTDIKRAKTIEELPEQLRTAVESAKAAGWHVDLDKGEYGKTANGEYRLVDVSEWFKLPRGIAQGPGVIPAVSPAPVAPTLTEGQRVAYTPEGSQGALVGTVAAVHADGTVDFQPTAGERMLDVSPETVRPLVARTGTAGAPGGVERRVEIAPPAEVPPPAASAAPTPPPTLAALRAERDRLKAENARLRGETGEPATTGGLSPVEWEKIGREDGEKGRPYELPAAPQGKISPPSNDILNAAREAYARGYQEGNASRSTQEAPRAATEPIAPAPPPEPAGEGGVPTEAPPPPGPPATGEPGRGAAIAARPEAAVAPAMGGGKANWLEALTSDAKERVFARMRSIQEAADSAAKKTKELAPRYGELPTGAEDFDTFIKDHARGEFLRSLRRGGTPEEAEASAKKSVVDAVAIHNKRWAKDYNMQRDKGTADSLIEDLRRSVEGEAGTQGEPTPTEGEPTVAAPEGGASVGPGAMAAGEGAPVKPFTTSMKNAVKDKERQERGEPQLFTVNRMSNPAAWDEAMRQIDENPDAQSYLIATLEANPRATTPVENALLLHRSVQLINERNDIAKQLFDAVEGGFEDRADDLRRRVEQVSDEMIQLEQVGRATGTKSGQSLQARKMMANEDYSLAKMEMRKRIAKGGEKLTPEEQATVERQAKRIAELEQALDARVAGAEGRASQQEADQVIKEIKERVAVEDAADKRTGVKRDVPAERDAIISGMTKASEDVPLEDLRPYIQRLAENFVRDGITERDPLIDAVHGVLKDIFPDITRRQTMDAISGFGDFKPLNPDPIKAKLRDLKGQMQQVAKLEDIQARKPLQKTGLERRIPSDEERRLIKLVEELKRRYGVVVTDPATQLKSALDAIKTRLRNDIADLEYQIATRKKIIKDKTGVAYDAEAQALKDRRDALKAQFDEVFGKPEMTPEQRVKLAMAAVERSIADLEARIKAKDIAPRRFLGKTPVTPELEAARVRRDALTAQLQELRDLDTTYQEQRQIKALERSIAEYERRAKEGDFAPAKGKPGVETEAVKEAMRRRDVARDALEALKEQAGYYNQARVEAALAAVEKANAELSRRINAGEIEAKKKPSGTPVTPEIAAARMEHELLSGILQDLRKAARPKKTPEEIALQSLKTRMKNQTAELQEKLARGDFSTRPRREVVLDAEGQRLKGTLAAVKREYQEGLIKDKLARRTRAQKILAGALETTNLTRILMTSFDLSAVLRQGGFIAFGHPIRAAKVFPDMLRVIGHPIRALKEFPNVKKMWNALDATDTQHAIMEDILTRPNAPLYARAKLYFSDQAGTLAQMEEAYMSRWAEKIPGIGASQRAFTTFLNRLRADSFDAMVEGLGRKGEVTTEEAKAIANFINVATGRGKVGMSEGAAVGLNTVFFSPRYLASRFQLLAGQPLYRGSWRTRKAVAKEYAKFLTGAAVVYALGAAAGGDIETDPRSSDFGKIRFGKTRLDPLTGLLQITVLLSRLASGTTKTLKGKLVPIRQEVGGRKLPFGKGDAADVIGRFLRTKLSPNVGAAVDILAGKTVVGEPATPESTAQRSLTPLAGQDIYEAMEDQGVPKGTIMGTLAFFGMGLQVYEDRKRQPPPSAARRLFRTLRDSFSRGREIRPSP